MFRVRCFYYWLLDLFSELPQLHNFTGFGLYDRRFIEALRRYHEPYPYFRGLVSEIGFRRILLDKYDFIIYPYALSQEEQERVEADPGNIRYSPRVVFRYNTGAIGNWNFPGKEEYLQSRKIR